MHVSEYIKERNLLLGRGFPDTSRYASTDLGETWLPISEPMYLYLKLYFEAQNSIEIPWKWGGCDLNKNGWRCKFSI